MDRDPGGRRLRDLCSAFSVHGRRRPPGIRLLALGLLLFAAASVAVVFAGAFKPRAVIFSGPRGRTMRITAPILAIAFLAAGGYLLSRSFRKIEPTDYDVRHADDDE
ncbi:MAG: hypothetical protein ABIW49_04240 [Knoellia sp.]